MRTGLGVFAIAMLLTACEEYVCGEGLMYSASERRCVCLMGFAETDGGVCIAVDAGPLSCAGGASAVSAFDDADGDGFGRPDSEHLVCPGTPGTAGNADDCDDSCAACYPGATEVCDGRDNDCAAGADDTFACVQGTATECETTCGSTGAATCASDCALPVECTPPSETCNGVDDDCDGVVDQGLLALGPPTSWGRTGIFASLERVEGGFVAAYGGADETGAKVFARTFDSSGRPTSEAVELAAAEAVALDTGLASDGVIAVAYATETAVMVTEIRADLEVVSPPRMIASAEDWVEVEAFGESFFAIYGGRGTLRGRSVQPRGGSLGIERTIVARDANDPSFAFVAAPTGVIGRAYLGYLDTPTTTPADSSTDSEVFVQQIGAFGADGPAFRVTDDLNDELSVAAVWARSALALTWISIGDRALTEGVLRAQVLEPAGSSTWTVLADADALGRASTAFAAQTRVVPTAQGWAFTYAQALPGFAAERRISLASRDLAWSTSDLSAEPAHDGSSFDFVLDMIGSESGGALLAFVRADVAGETSSTQANTLGCP